MSPKLLPTLPHIVENWGITIIFEIDIMKILTQINLNLLMSNLTFIQIFWLFLLF